MEPKKIDSLQRIAEKGRQYDLKFVGGCCGFGYHDIKLLASLIVLENGAAGQLSKLGAPIRLDSIIDCNNSIQSV